MKCEKKNKKLVKNDYENNNRKIEINIKQRANKMIMQSGITIIALMVTIVILLIIAGIGINFVIEQNGLINKIKEAKEKTIKAKNYEDKLFSDVENQISDFDEIDWSKAFKNSKKHPEQKKSETIGIGTDGKTVNMDLWEYTYDAETNGYCLNDETALKLKGSSWGYLGSFNNGKIIGKMPQYIKAKEDNNFIPVTNLIDTFNKCIELEYSPKIPDTVISMRGTFADCENLYKAPELPSKLENMYGTFIRCKKIEVAPQIPNNVTNMSNTFKQCISLKAMPIIPNKVENMSYTFQLCSGLAGTSEIPNSVKTLRATFLGCSNLENAPVIPSSVINLRDTFRNCTKLQGNLVINAKISGIGVDEDNAIDYGRCLENVATEEGITLKISGECTMLKELLSTANSGNVSIQE